MFRDDRHSSPNIAMRHAFSPDQRRSAVGLREIEPDVPIAEDMHVVRMNVDKSQEAQASRARKDDHSET